MRRILPLLLFGCSSPDTSTGSDLSPLKDLSMSSDLRALSDLSSGGYPAGPYGNQVGDTMPLLSWIGYSVPLADVVATTKPYAPYSMNDLRLSGAPYGVVHVAEFF
jgi:hypothetical protein